jgi:hypothetical protein
MPRFCQLECALETTTFDFTRLMASCIERPCRLRSQLDDDLRRRPHEGATRCALAVVQASTAFGSGRAHPVRRRACAQAPVRRGLLPPVLCRGHARQNAGGKWPERLPALRPPLAKLSLGENRLNATAGRLCGRGRAGTLGKPLLRGVEPKVSTAARDHAHCSRTFASPPHTTSRRSSLGNPRAITRSNK